MFVTNLEYVMYAGKVQVDAPIASTITLLLAKNFPILMGYSKLLGKTHTNPVGLYSLNKTM